MTQFELNVLQAIIEISKNTIPASIDSANVTEEEIATSVNHALQMFDINDSEFESFANLIQLERYCDIKTLRLAVELQGSYTKEKSERIDQIIQELVESEIPSLCFRKYIYTKTTGMILRLKQLRKYPDFVEKTLELMKDDNIKNITIFN